MRNSLLISTKMRRRKRFTQFLSKLKKTWFEVLKALNSNLQELEKLRIYKALPHQSLLRLAGRAKFIRTLYLKWSKNLETFDLAFFWIEDILDLNSLLRKMSNLLLLSLMKDKMRQSLLSTISNLNITMSILWKRRDTRERKTSISTISNLNPNEKTLNMSKETPSTMTTTQTKKTPFKILQKQPSNLPSSSRSSSSIQKRKSEHLQTPRPSNHEISTTPSCPPWLPS